MVRRVPSVRPVRMPVVWVRRMVRMRRLVSVRGMRAMARVLVPFVRGCVGMMPRIVGSVEKTSAAGWVPEAGERKPHLAPSTDHWGQRKRK